MAVLLAVASLEPRLLGLARVGYALAALLYLIGLFVRPRPLRITGTLVLALGWACYTLMFVLRVARAQRLPLESPYDLLLWFDWWLVLVYLVVENRTRVTLPGLLIAGMSCGLGAVLRRSASSFLPLLPQQASPWYGLHAATLYVADALLAVAVTIELSSLFFPVLTRHEERATVERQERYLEFRSYAYRLILFAFPLLSFAIISNALWRSAIRGHYWAWGREETWALITWILFACYLHLRTQVRTSRVLTRVVSLFGAAAIALTFSGVDWIVRLLKLTRP